MRRQFSKLALAAGVSLAITLTLSCSSDDGGGGTTCGGKAYDTGKYGCVNNELVGTCGGSYYNPENERCLNGEIQNGAEIAFPSSSSGNGQGGSFNVNSQIYNEDGTIYKGNGIIEATRDISVSGPPPCMPDAISCDGSTSHEWDHIRAGSVTNGIVSLELGKAVPADKYLSDFLEDDEQRSCTSYPPNIKSAGRYFILTNSSGNFIGDLTILYEDEQVEEAILYYYFSKNGEIACNIQYEDDGVVYSKKNFSIDAKNGWNKTYLRKRKDGIRTTEYSTNNILTKEVRWTFSGRENYEK